MVSNSFKYEYIIFIFSFLSRVISLSFLMLFLRTLVVIIAHSLNIILDIGISGNPYFDVLCFTSERFVIGASSQGLACRHGVLNSDALNSDIFNSDVLNSDVLNCDRLKF